MSRARLLRLLHRVLALVRCERSRLVLPGLPVGCVHGERGDEDVLLHLALQHLAGVAHPERQAGGVVDADIPLAAGERLEVARVAVAHELLDRRGPLLRPPAAVEQRQLVPTREGVAHLVGAGEAGAAQDQDAQRAWPALLRLVERGHGRSGALRGQAERAGPGELQQVPASGHPHLRCACADASTAAPAERVSRVLEQTAGFPQLPAAGRVSHAAHGVARDQQLLVGRDDVARARARRPRRRRPPCRRPPRRCSPRRARCRRSRGLAADPRPHLGRVLADAAREHDRVGAVHLREVGADVLLHAQAEHVDRRASRDGPGGRAPPRAGRACRS